MQTISISLAPDGHSLLLHGKALPRDPIEALAAIHETLRTPLHGDARLKSEAPPVEARRAGSARPRDGRTLTTYPDGSTIRVIQPASRKISRRTLTLEDLGL